jgi:hypothetical protein
MAATADARAAISDSTWCCASIAWACRPLIFWTSASCWRFIRPPAGAWRPGWPAGRQVGPALGQAGEHVALRAHGVLHQDQPGRELVRALRLQHDRELAHAAVLVGGRAIRPISLWLAMMLARVSSIWPWARATSAFATWSCSPSSRSRPARPPADRAPGPPWPGRRQLGLRRVQRVRRVPQRGRGLVHVGLEVLQRPVHLVLAGPRSEASAGATSPRQRAAITARVSADGHAWEEDSGRSTTVLTGRCAVSVRPGPGMRPWNGHSARSG